MADIISPQDRSRNMSAIKSKDTKPEIFIRKKLFARGYRYRIYPASIPGHPDLYMPKYKMAIFIHGCFWHHHAGCRYAYTPKSRVEFWSKKFEVNIIRDTLVRKMLDERGIRHMIIWECAIRAAQKSHNNTDQLIDSIEESILSDRKSFEFPV